MSLQWMTIASGIRELWPGRYNRTLAEALGVPRATTRSWLSGKRRMPIARMREMADVLRHDIAVANSALAYLQVEIARREREPLKGAASMSLRIRAMEPGVTPAGRAAQSGDATQWVKRYS
jgi:hypothetical protein